ncbi:S8 family serine peptidase [Gottfriedia acidiceleris]|uniref:S8 family serine peptidase n=1 Tax=Gottfriedia acidiceleris TaxID=371036 RepID=UPI003D25427C
MKKKQTKLLVGALTTSIVFSQSQMVNVFAQSPTKLDEAVANLNTNSDTNTNEDSKLNLTAEQRQALKNIDKFNARGLHLSDDVDLDSSKTVSVIVEFNNKPKKVALLEAAVNGQNLSPTEAQSNVDDDHATFQTDLENTVKNGTYKVKRSFKTAFNGVSLQVPANKLQELVQSGAVKAIYSNQTVQLDEPKTPDAQATSTEADTHGMAAERSYLKIDQLHKEGFTGKGIKVGILDTGIDYNHPDLKDAYKGGYDFVNNDNDPMETTYDDWVKAGKPSINGGAEPYYTEHGTHVAGTIAGRGKADSHLSTTGVAPDADIYAYRVLGPGGGGTMDAIISGIDRAVTDGMDVINLSLGAPYNDPLTPQSMALNYAVLSGVTAIVAAGNSGDAMYTVGNPGNAALPLTVGASDVPTIIPTIKGNDDGVSYSMQLLARGFDDKISDLLTKSYPIVNVGLGQSFNYSGANTRIDGKIAFIQRGTNTINDKILQAKNRGAAGVIIYNNVDGLMPFYLSEGEDFIPSFNLTMADGLALKQQIASGKTTFSFSDLSSITTKGDELASFSSRGPSRVNYDIKPEVTAPGVSVLSTVPGFIHSPNNPTDYNHAYDHMSGTSMATPFVAGVAALLKQANHNLQPEDIKALLMNTADPLSKTYSVYEVGAGRVDPYQALHSSIEIKVKDTTPVVVNGETNDIEEITSALSFGNVAFTGKDLVESRSLTFENNGSKSKTFDVKVSYQTNVRGSKDAEKNGVTVTTDKTVKVPVNSNVTRKVDLSIPTTAEKGIYEGYVTYTNQDDPSETYRVPFGVHFVEEGIKDFTLSRNSITNDRNQLKSPIMQPALTATMTLNSHMRSLYVVLSDAKTGEDLGIANTFDGMGFEEGKTYFFQPFVGAIYPFADKEHKTISKVATLPREGHYKLKLVGVNDDGKEFVNAQDLFIDNTAPDKFEMKVQGENERSPFVEYKKGVTAIPVTASLHDQMVDQMRAVGIDVNQGTVGIPYAWNSNSINGKLTLDEHGNGSDSVAVTPNSPITQVLFVGGDQGTNANAQELYYLVEDNYSYVYGDPQGPLRHKQMITHVGDTRSSTLTAYNVTKVKSAVYTFSANTLDTNFESIKLNPAAEALGGVLSTTTTTANTVNGPVVTVVATVTFDGTKEVTGDIPMVDVAVKIQDIQKPVNGSSLSLASTKITSVDGVVTRPWGTFPTIVILPKFSSLGGYVYAQGLFKNGKFDETVGRDYTLTGMKAFVQDKDGKRYDGAIAKNGQYVVNGLPLTHDDMSIVFDVPGHFNTYTSFHGMYQTLDGEEYGVAGYIGRDVYTATAGDVNKDNVIDIMDALAIQTYWGTNKRSADINFDGKVDVNDFAYVYYNYGLGNPTNPNANPKAKKTYKGQTLESIIVELGLN